MTLSSDELVPGDVFEVPVFSKMPCDAMLLQGIAVMNEAMLTGESIPVVKSAFPPENTSFSATLDKKHTLYSGTEVIQVRQSSEGQEVLALAV